MERKTQTGFLLLADISGYTSFVAQTEIKHANIALSFLLETIVEKLSNCLTISKLEGDAVFAFRDEIRLPDGKSLLELIDHTNMAFRDQVKALHAIPTLGLKFLVHHGEFVIQQVAGIRDLLGTAVNLLHRLAKNHVTESTGWKGDALFTDQGLEYIQADKSSFVQQAESCDHLGEVETYAMDMQVRYEALKAS